MQVEILSNDILVQFLPRVCYLFGALNEILDEKGFSKHFFFVNKHNSLELYVCPHKMVHNTQSNNPDCFHVFLCISAFFYYIGKIIQI